MSFLCSHLSRDFPFHRVEDKILIMTRKPSCNAHSHLSDLIPSVPALSPLPLSLSLSMFSNGFRLFKDFFFHIKYFLITWSITHWLDDYGSTFVQITVPTSPGLVICSLRNVYWSPIMCQTLKIQNYKSQSLSPEVLQSTRLWWDIFYK